LIENYKSSDAKLFDNNKEDELNNLLKEINNEYHNKVDEIKSIYKSNKVIYDFLNNSDDQFDESFI